MHAAGGPAMHLGKVLDEAGEFVRHLQLPALKRLDSRLEGGETGLVGVFSRRPRRTRGARRTRGPSRALRAGRALRPGRAVCAGLAPGPRLAGGSWRALRPSRALWAGRAGGAGRTWLANAGRAWRP